ncbi:MAG: heavy-metal-associated domain-containing protein [Gemmataceae bacterium]|nr:heavy-metal-associated domain-containing protein [Gemmataceae bacterium]
MRSLLSFAAVGVVALAPTGYAQEPKPPAQSEVTKATYLVSGLHCPPCAATVEGSLKKVKGVKSVRVDFPSKNATIEFDEAVIPAQEVARAVSGTPHMMGKDMRYGGIFVLSVPGVQDAAAGRKAEAALRNVEGVARVALYPQQQAVGVEFADTGKVTSKQLIDALTPAGLKGAQYATASAPAGPGMNGGNGSMADHAGMAMGNGGVGGHGAMGGMGCGSMPGMLMTPGAVRPYSAYPAPRVYGGGCGCCR